MIEDFIQRMRSLDLMYTDLEGDDWCTQTDLVLQEAADVMENLHQQLLKMNANARSLGRDERTPIKDAAQALWS
jgi:hypothetical protein